MDNTTHIDDILSAYLPPTNLYPAQLAKQGGDTTSSDHLVLRLPRPPHLFTERTHMSHVRQQGGKYQRRQRGCDRTSGPRCQNHHCKQAICSPTFNSYCATLPLS